MREPISGSPGLCRESLETPRRVMLRDRQPAILLGFITTENGRRLWAEIVSRTHFVQPGDVAEFPTEKGE
jgi:hypothetical protein